MTEGFRGIRGAAGEHGIFQVMPATGQEVCRELAIYPCDLSNTSTNIRVGMRYIAKMQALWRDEGNTVRAYNGGPNGPNNPRTEVYVQRFQEHVRNLEACSRPETKPLSSTSRDSADIHIIQPGESLSTIAQQHNTTVEELQRLNGISNPNVIFAGTALRIR